MKKLIISGSSKLYERAIYWRGYFEGRGYEVIDWPAPVLENDPDATDDDSIEDGPVPGFYPTKPLTKDNHTYAKSLIGTYKRFWKNLDRADVLFIMNEDRHGITGYVGAGTYAEQHVITNNLNHHHQTEIYLLKMPDKSQGCFEEIGFWLEQDLVKIYRPPRVKPTVCEPAPREPVEKASPASTGNAADSSGSVEPANTATPIKHGLFSRSSEKTLNLATCKDRALRPLTPSLREYLKIFSPPSPLGSSSISPPPSSNASKTSV